VLSGVIAVVHNALQRYSTYDTLIKLVIIKTGVDMKKQTTTLSQTVLPFAGILVLLSILAQVVTALNGSDMTLVSALALAPAALYYVYFMNTSKTTLSKMRYGQLVAHMVAFLVVNLSYHIHATFLVLGEASRLQQPVLTLPSGWFGATFGMFVVWGIWLLVHIFVSVARRGYEDLEV
jgi:hypothetical protein